MLERKRFIIDPENKRAEEVRANGIRYLQTLEITKPVEVIIRRYRRSLTDEQRGWFHKLCTMLGDEVGEQMGDIKQMVKQRVYGTEEHYVGGKAYTITPSSETDDEGEKRSVFDYAKLTDEVYRMGGEAGVSLPEPDPMLARRMKRRTHPEPEGL